MEKKEKNILLISEYHIDSIKIPQNIAKIIATGALFFVHDDALDKTKML